MSGFLWHGGYTLFRWFECFADLPVSDWRGRRLIEFGSGVGLAGLMAAINGANVMLVDISATWDGLAMRNVKKNLPRRLWNRVSICSFNWSRHLIRVA